MAGILRTRVPMAAGNRRQPIFAALAIVAAVGVLGSGCRPSHPTMIPVRGKFTLDGGPWPKAGTIMFCPVKAAEGFPSRPGMAVFGPDGVFTAKTDQHEGLIPGEYLATVTCWEKEPDSGGGGGKSYAPLRFTVPYLSGLALKVPPDSGTVTWDKDFPRGDAPMTAADRQAIPRIDTTRSSGYGQVPPLQKQDRPKP